MSSFTREVKVTSCDYCKIEAKQLQAEASGGRGPVLDEGWQSYEIEYLLDAAFKKSELRGWIPLLLLHRLGWLDFCCREHATAYFIELSNVLIGLVIEFPIIYRYSDRK